MGIAAIIDSEERVRHGRGDVENLGGGSEQRAVFRLFI